MDLFNTLKDGAQHGVENNQRRNQDRDQNCPKVLALGCAHRRKPLDLARLVAELLGGRVEVHVKALHQVVF